MRTNVAKEAASVLVVALMMAVYVTVLDGDASLAVWATIGFAVAAVASLVWKTRRRE